MSFCLSSWYFLNLTNRLRNSLLENWWVWSKEVNNCSIYLAKLAFYLLIWNWFGVFNCPGGSWPDGLSWLPSVWFLIIAVNNCCFVFYWFVDYKSGSIIWLILVYFLMAYVRAFYSVSYAFWEPLLDSTFTSLVFDWISKSLNEPRSWPKSTFANFYDDFSSRTLFDALDGMPESFFNDLVCLI